MTHKVRCTPPDVAADVDRTCRALLGRIEERVRALEAWREHARAGYEEVEATAVEDTEPEGIPDDAPPRYSVVCARVDRGDYSWEDVFSGAVTDPDARAVHVWLDSRLDLIRRAWREMDRGADADEAVGLARADVERERRTA